MTGKEAAHDITALKHSLRYLNALTTAYKDGVTLEDELEATRRGYEELLQDYNVLKENKELLEASYNRLLLDYGKAVRSLIWRNNS